MPVELTIRAMDGPCSGRLSSFGFSGTIAHGLFLNQRHSRQILVYFRYSNDLISQYRD